MAGFHTKTFIKHDDYMTPSYAWENIKTYLPKDKTIWECFYGDGESGKELTKLGLYDLIVITTSHKYINYKKIIQESQLILDTRNATKKFPNQKNVILL